MKTVIVFSQPDCPPCEWTKEFLARNNIPHIVRDIRVEAGARDELLAMGFRSTPVTLIDGIAVVGFDQERLMALLAAE